jgi:hypothetical protein
MRGLGGEGFEVLRFEMILASAFGFKTAGAVCTLKRLLGFNLLQAFAGSFALKSAASLGAFPRAIARKSITFSAEPLTAALAHITVQHHFCVFTHIPIPSP